MKPFIFFIFLAYSISGYSQNYLCNYLKQDTTFIYNQMETDYLDDYQITMDKDCIWFYKYNASYTHSNEFTMYCFHIDSLVLDSFIIKIPSLNFLLKKNYYDNFSYFSVENNSILLGYQNKMFVLKKKDNAFKMHKKIKIAYQSSPNYVSFLSENQIFLARNTNFSFEPSIEDNTFLASYSLYPLVEKHIIKPYFKFIASSHCLYGGDFFSINNEKTLISFHQRVNYQIDVYDATLKLFESIRFSPDYWNTIPDRQIKAIDSAQQARFIISAVIPLLEKYSFLDDVYWIDSNTIITKYFNNNQRYYDFIKKQNGKWQIANNQLIVEAPNNNALITKDQFWVIKQYMDKVFFYKDKMICISCIPQINPLGMKIDEYTNIKKKHLEQKSPALSITIFSLKEF